MWQKDLSAHVPRGAPGVDSKTLEGTGGQESVHRAPSEPGLAKGLATRRFPVKTPRTSLAKGFTTKSLSPNRSRPLPIKDFATKGLPPESRWALAHTGKGIASDPHWALAVKRICDRRSPLGSLPGPGSAKGVATTISFAPGIWRRKGTCDQKPTPGPGYPWAQGRQREPSQK